MAGWTPMPGRIAPGLHLVSTPIGAARDITLRALDLLAGADVLAAEDTRTLRHLMEIHGVALNGRMILPYHDHNGAEMRPKIMALLAEGKSVAYASEAGTPLVADPGFQLAREAIALGQTVLAAPGASAVLCALTVSGLPSDRFLFAGFLPPKSAARKTALSDLAKVPATLIFYESPNRVAATLADMVEILGPGRQAALCRELTKKFEEVRRASLADLASLCRETGFKGEIVLLIDRATEVPASSQDIESALRNALLTLSSKDAAAAVAQAFGLPRRDVYQMALSLGDAE
ncbi:16S rRNA (cytidine(1402)-2'-O)-methyltransferase [Stagnihabitans tardus]|uniref:Ribosomal RNA small subunit methyltransferase I n=1 Tax=Stagnihabitans tardus TaxID=2699202 RepID=A0AAE5BV46_9RHOB|nr:16S rRNA (cytidine(1402)-2'-O)-methyltransferase [Stagnihabitans tardus]NBZ88551.1 16S rRNA (cytidine(1402)-2'-O)-methyltransferase [Stagnihabitans tardus]